MELGFTTRHFPPAANVEKMFAAFPLDAGPAPWLEALRQLLLASRDAAERSPRVLRFEGAIPRYLLIEKLRLVFLKGDYEPSAPDLDGRRGTS